MNPPAVIAPQPSQVTPVSSVPELSDTLSLALYDLIARQPFFKGLNPHHLKLLTDSALEMKFEPEQTIFVEGSPANRFYLILEGKVGLESEIAERGIMIPIQTLGPGDDLGWAWLFPPYSLHFSARIGANQNDIFLWATFAGAVRTRPRNGLSNHEANCRSGNPIIRRHPASLNAIH